MFNRNRPKTWEEFQRKQGISYAADWVVITLGIGVTSFSFYFDSNFWSVIGIWLISSGRVGLYDTHYHMRDRFVRDSGLSYAGQKLFILKQRQEAASKDGNL